MKKLVVNGRYLSWDDGTPFFYLGDTAWEMLHRLSREETEFYLKTRSGQGFTAVQTVLLAEQEGATTPNYYGRLPLKFTNGLPDPAKPDTDAGYSYWEQVDFAVKTAEKYGLFMTLLPTWGDKFHLCWGKGPVIFTPENAEKYGAWIARRYKNSPNIIWMLGGDRPVEPEHRKILDAMARGIRSADHSHLITFHPTGERNSAQDMCGAEYLDFHTAQTGHGVGQCYRSDEVMREMANRSPKPFLDSEARYEDHPACFKAELGYFWNADDVRQNAYWNVLAGACGHTYGNHAVWSMNRKPSAYCPFVWQDVLSHPGAEQMRYLKQLRLARDYFSLHYEPSLICGNYEGMGHIVPAAGKGYAYAYSPLGLPVTADLSKTGAASCVRALWFDPRTGEETLFSVLPAQGRATLVPPDSGKGHDWVLVLEGVSLSK